MFIQVQWTFTQLIYIALCMKINIKTLITGSAVLGSLLVAGTALAAGPGFGHGGMMGRVPGVFGTVSAINGSTITVNSKGFGPNATATTYTVDGTNATVTKNGAASSVGNIAIGDIIMVQGTVSGTNVTATTIRDGMPQGMPGRGWGPHASTTPKVAPYVPQGNGEPVVGGSVTAIDGTTLTITNKAGVTYTADASNAAVSIKGATSTVSSIATGDSVVVQGTVNGTSITASSIIDSGAAPSNSANSSAPGPRPGGFGAFLGGIGSFFKHIFGFF